MALSEAALTAIIGAAGAATSAGIGAGAQASSNRRQWKYWQKQHDIQLQDWYRTQFYNSPAAQMKRYEEAGLNPNLIYGQQNVASELNSPPAPQYREPLEAISQGFGNAVNSALTRYAQMKQLQIQQENSDALVKLYAAKEELSREQSALTNQKAALENMKRIAYDKHDYYGKQGDILDLKLRQGEQAIKKLIMDTNIASLQKDFLEKTLQNRVMQSSLKTTEMQRYNTFLRHRNDYMFQHKNIEAWKLKYYANMIPHQVSMALTFDPLMESEKLKSMQMENRYNVNAYPLMQRKLAFGNMLIQQQAMREALGIQEDIYDLTRKNRESKFRNFNNFGAGLYNFKKTLFK